MVAENAPAANLRRILVVEDLEDSRESLQELLETALRVDVDAAEDGSRAMQMIAQHSYALVITDLRMPKASGMWLLREIKDRQVSCAVVVVTGHGGVREAVEAMRLGAYDFLTKPLDPQQLVMMVQRVLRERCGEPLADGEDGRDGPGEAVSLLDPATAPTTGPDGTGT
jgi:DNA-binding NtrC family response regulator